MNNKYNSLLYGDELYERLIERNKLLIQLVEEKNKEIEKSPKGIINIGVCKRGTLYPQYYVKFDSDEKRHYISRKENEKLINAIIQREYDEKIVKDAEHEIRIMQHLLRIKQKDRVEKLYENLPMARKAFINPIIATDEKYIAEWEELEYTPMPFEDEASEIYTKKGERVRSKTERMIANTLYEHSIPYKYECPILQNGKVIARPDFTVLNVKKRKQYYWEHFGMMDDANYANGFVKKITMYAKNDICPGENLISTYEASGITINEKDVENIIAKYLV